MRWSVVISGYVGTQGRGANWPGADAPAQEGKSGCVTQRRMKSASSLLGRQPSPAFRLTIFSPAPKIGGVPFVRVALPRHVATSVRRCRFEARGTPHEKGYVLVV